MKKLIQIVVWSLLASTGIQAEEDKDFKHFSISLNVVPKLQNTTDKSVPGENQISDNAYQYQLNYINQPSDDDKGSIEQRLDYFSFRAFAYKRVYTDTEESSRLDVRVGSVDGYAALYGRRYLLSGKGYQGIGLGLCAGFALVNEIYVQKGASVAPIKENKGIFVVAVELFYKLNLTKNIYIEPVVTGTYDNGLSLLIGGGSPISFAPAIIAGGQF